MKEMIFVRLILLLVVGAAFAVGKDAVFWTSDADRSTFYSAEQLVHSAEESSPVILFLVDGFTLADFSRLASVYTYTSTAESSPALPALTKWLAASKGYAGEWLTEKAEDFAGKQSSLLRYRDHADDEALKSAALIIVEAESLSEIDPLVDHILSSLGDRTYRALLTGKKEAKKHVISKRAADYAVGDGAKPHTFINGTTCLLYLDRLIVEVVKTGSTSNTLITINGTATKSSAKCGNGTKTGTTAYDLEWTNGKWSSDDGKVTVSSIKLTLNYVLSTSTYWVLQNITVRELTIFDSNSGYQLWNITSSAPANTRVDQLEMYSVLDFCYACWETATSFIIAPAKYKSYSRQGIAFFQLQVQPFGATNGLFSTSVDDCVPFFTAGTWMGIIVAFVLLAILLFGLTMLSGLKTMDRFDDPKGKQLQINVRE